MKKIIFETKNKMKFESEYKTFNRQTNIITHGNVIANTQVSNFIRPWNEVKNGGYIGKPGDFVKFDIQPFGYIPENMWNIIFDKNRKESVILYRFNVYNEKMGRSQTIGFVLADYNNNLIDYDIICNYGCSYWKRYSAIQECIKYICN